jgi:hypothetical protein
MQARAGQPNRESLGLREQFRILNRGRFEMIDAERSESHCFLHHPHGGELVGVHANRMAKVLGLLKETHTVRK